MCTHVFCVESPLSTQLKVETLCDTMYLKDVVFDSAGCLLVIRHAVQFQSPLECIVVFYMYTLFKNPPKLNKW